MTPEQAIAAIREYIDGGDEDGNLSVIKTDTALEVLRLQMIEYKRANRDLKVECEGLKGQLSAVPVQAIALYWEATYVDYGRLDHADHMKVAKADEAVENWVVEVKYGKKEATK